MKGRKSSQVHNTAHNTISCHKIIIKTPDKWRKPNKTPKQHFFTILSFLHYFLFFLPFKLCSPVISPEIFNLKCTILGFYKAGRKSSCPKNNSSLCTICNQKLIFHFNIAIGTTSFINARVIFKWSGILVNWAVQWLCLQGTLAVDGELFSALCVEFNKQCCLK